MINSIIPGLKVTYNGNHYKVVKMDSTNGMIHIVSTDGHAIKHLVTRSLLTERG